MKNFFDSSIWSSLSPAYTNFIPMCSIITTIIAAAIFNNMSVILGMKYKRSFVLPVLSVAFVSFPELFSPITPLTSLFLVWSFHFGNIFSELNLVFVSA